MNAAADLQAWRDKLVQMRAKGVRTFTDQNGESVTYASDRDMAAALASIDRELAALAGTRSPKTILFRTSKGL
jgi:hypothetical protein